MDVIIIPGKKNVLFSYLGMAKDVSIFWASWMFRVENCDPRGVAACFGPSEGELSIWKHLGHLCFEINADGSSKSRFRKGSDEPTKNKTQAQIGEMINHKTTRTKQSHCQPSRLNKPTYSNQLNEINETTKPNQPDQAKPSHKKQSHYCKPYRFCAKENNTVLGASWIKRESSKKHWRVVSHQQTSRIHMDFCHIFCPLEKIWHFWHLKSRKSPLVPCCIIQLEDQWSTLSLKGNMFLSVGTKSKSGSANSGLAKTLPKCGVAGGGNWQVLSIPNLFFNVKWCLQTLSNTITQN